MVKILFPDLIFSLQPLNLLWEMLFPYINLSSPVNQKKTETVEHA